MEHEIIFKHENLVLTLYPKESCIVETWKGFTNDTIFKELLDKTMLLKVENRVKNLILDTREHKGLSPEGQKHGVEVCDAHAKKHGKMKHAIIVPKDIFSKFSVENFTRNFDENALVVNKYFDNINDALNWMNEA